MVAAPTEGHGGSDAPMRAVQNCLVLILLVTLSINAVQIKHWSEGLWYPSPIPWCISGAKGLTNGAPSNAVLPGSDDSHSVGSVAGAVEVGSTGQGTRKCRDIAHSVKGIEEIYSEFQSRSSKIVKELEHLMLGGPSTSTKGPCKTEQEAASQTKKSTGKKGKKAAGGLDRSRIRPKVRKVPFRSSAKALEILNTIRKAVEHVGLILPTVKDNITFATNSADKIKYQLDNFEPMKHRFSEPQWNDISMESQSIERNAKQHQPDFHFLRRKSFLIGISTVNRETNYLLNTLISFFHELTESERLDVTVLIYNGDRPPSKHTDIPLVKKKFKEYIASGMLKIIEDEEPHPELTDPSKLARRWGDSLDRVKWRSKQVLDVATLMDYAAKNPDGHRYFLMMEDDIKAAQRFTHRARDWIDNKIRFDTTWTIASFYNPWEDAKDMQRMEPYKFFGVIGQVFRIHDLPVVVEFLRKNFDQSPLDWLFVDFLHKVNGTIIVSSPSLFQHQGTVSSLKGKVQSGRSVDFEYEPRYQLSEV